MRPLMCVSCPHMPPTSPFMRGEKTGNKVRIIHNQFTHALAPAATGAAAFWAPLKYGELQLEIAAIHGGSL